MEISEDDLRVMVRNAIAQNRRPDPAQAIDPALARHASHGVLALVTGGDAEGRCLIEPTVPCTHCGFCLSLGH